MVYPDKVPVRALRPRAPLAQPGDHPGPIRVERVVNEHDTLRVKALGRELHVRPSRLRGVTPVDAEHPNRSARRVAQHPRVHRRRVPFDDREPAVVVLLIFVPFMIIFVRFIFPIAHALAHGCFYIA